MTPRSHRLPSFSIDDSAAITLPRLPHAPWPPPRPPQSWTVTLRIPRLRPELRVFGYGLAAGGALVVVLWLLALGAGRRASADVDPPVHPRAGLEPAWAPDPVPTPRRASMERSPEQPPVVRAEDLPIATPAPEPRAATIAEATCPAIPGDVTASPRRRWAPQAARR